MAKRIVIGAACVVAAVAAGARGATTTAAITQGSIAHAQLGQSQSASSYEALLGTPYVRQNLDAPDGWSRLRFSKRKMSVYFTDQADKGVIVTTWNRYYKTAAGIHPCSTTKRLKAVYRKRLRPSRFSVIGGTVFAYTVGRNLLFATNNQRTVQAIALFDGSDPNRNRRGGSLSYAGFVALNETACR